MVHTMTIGNITRFIQRYFPDVEVVEGTYTQTLTSGENVSYVRYTDSYFGAVLSVHDGNVYDIELFNPGGINTTVVYPTKCMLKQLLSDYEVANYD